MVSMCRWLILVVLTLVACASPPPPPPDLPAPWAERQLPRAATVLLDLGGNSYCGAVSVDARHLVTARHCIGSGFALFRTSPTDATYDPAQVIASDPESDLALLRVIGTEFTTWPTIRGAPASGEPVRSINHGSGQLWCTHDGYAQGMAGLFVVTDVPITPGASGSGLWDEQDRLIGIVSHYELAGVNSFFGSGDAVRKLLASVSR